MDSDCNHCGTPMNTPPLYSCPPQELIGAEKRGALSYFTFTSVEECNNGSGVGGMD